MDIREAKLEDVPKILPVWREFIDFHGDRDPFYKTCDGAEKAFTKYVGENIDKDDTSVFVAEVDGNIVGYCRCLTVATPPILEIKHYGSIADLAVL